MLAPKSAYSEVKVGGETIVLRLNFHSISLAEDNGIVILSENPPELATRQGLTFLKCLALEDQPYFTEDHAATLVSEAPEGTAAALLELFEKYAGKSEGKPKGRKAKKAA